MKNKITKEKRVIDLNVLTTSLDGAHKQVLLEALNGFNKLSLWEFAKEATNSIGKYRFVRGKFLSKVVRLADKTRNCR
jgi:hypothetical protein